MPAAGVPASLRSSAVPLYRRYMGTAGLSSSSVPSVDELSELQSHLQVLGNDAHARLTALRSERRGEHAESSGTPEVLTIKDEEEDLPLAGSAIAGAKRERDMDEWEPDEGRRVHRTGVVSRTYGRGSRRQSSVTASSVDPSSQTDADTKAETDMMKRRMPLGVKLRMTHVDDTRRDEGGSLGILADVRAESFPDSTTFSWDVPVETETALPQLEPVRLPRPYPTHPLDVHEDFANRDWRERDSMYSVSAPTPSAPGARDTGRARQTKETSQVPMTTFFNYADAYFKPVTEDDLAWLSSKADDPYPFQFPELGLHYRKVWEKEDAEMLGVLGAVDGGAGAKVRPRTWAARDKDDDDLPLAMMADRSVPQAPAGPSSLALDELMDEHMYNRLVQGGPLVERLAASLILPGSDAAALEAPSPSQGDAHGDDAPAPRVHQSLADMEAQARQACEAVGLLEANMPVSWQEQADGPISVALRLAQERLRRQIKVNEQRKLRLFRIAVDRMAYQDYQACLQAVDREIEASWTKRQRQIKANAGKKRKVEADALQNRPYVPEAMERRRHLKAAFEPMFAKIPHARAPPTESIYQGLDL